MGTAARRTVERGARTHDADAGRCAEVARRHGRTFSIASWFLPPAKRRSAYALYAFCRVADDMVDQAGTSPGGDVAARLAAYRRRLDAALAGAPDDAIFRELHAAVERHRVPGAVLHELLDGVERDLRPVRYATWVELARYCEGVASSVAEMCAHVFGVDGGDETRERAMRYARTLGVAMQLTNILRDVGDDALRGRCYLPDEDLDTFGLARADVLAGGDLASDERWRPLVAFEIGRARALYEAALPGIPLLAPDARRCAAACAVGYAAILGRIERNGYDNVTRRASLGAAGRARLLPEILRVAGREPGAAPAPRGPAPAAHSPHPAPAGGLPRLA